MENVDMDEVFYIAANNIVKAIFLESSVLVPEYFKLSSDLP